MKIRAWLDSCCTEIVPRPQKRSRSSSRQAHSGEQVCGQNPGSAAGRSGAREEGAWAWLETGVMASPSWTKHPSDLGARSARSSEGFRPEPHHTWSPEKLREDGALGKRAERGDRTALALGAACVNVETAAPASGPLSLPSARLTETVCPPWPQVRGATRRPPTRSIVTRRPGQRAPGRSPPPCVPTRP